jgi:hypothetical protein
MDIDWCSVCLAKQGTVDYGKRYSCTKCSNMALGTQYEKYIFGFRICQTCAGI